MRKPHTDETKRKMSEAMRVAWKEGRKKGYAIGPEQARKISELKKIQFAEHPINQETKRRMSESSKKAFQEGRKKTPENFLGAGALKTKGSHGFGRNQKDRIDHYEAKLWIIKSPENQTFEISNLHAWARANESIFDDGLRELKLPCWQRFCVGMGSWHQWKGWAVVSVTDIK